jgi:hypothetical protein
VLARRWWQRWYSAAAALLVARELDSAVATHRVGPLAAA